MRRARCCGPHGTSDSVRSGSSTVPSRAAAATASTWCTCGAVLPTPASSGKYSQGSPDLRICTESHPARHDDARIRQNGHMTDAARHLLVVAHTGRADSLEAGIHVCRRLIDAGITPVVSDDELSDLRTA